MRTDRSPQQTRDFALDLLIEQNSRIFDAIEHLATTPTLRAASACGRRRQRTTTSREWFTAAEPRSRLAGESPVCAQRLPRPRQRESVRSPRDSSTERVRCPPGEERCFPGPGREPAISSPGTHRREPGSPARRATRGGRRSVGESSIPDRKPDDRLERCRQRRKSRGEPASPKEKRSEPRRVRSERARRSHHIPSGRRLKRSRSFEHPFAAALDRAPCANTRTTSRPRPECLRPRGGSRRDRPVLREHPPLRHTACASPAVDL